MSTGKVKLSRIVKDKANELRLPDYFFEGEVFLTVQKNGLADHWSTPFSEAHLIGERIVVFHKATTNDGWTATDFLTGCAVVHAPAKNGLLSQATERIHQAPPDFFDAVIPVNTRAFREAVNYLLNLVSRASTKTQYSGFLSAAHAIVDEVLTLDVNQLP